MREFPDSGVASSRQSIFQKRLLLRTKLDGAIPVTTTHSGKRVAEDEPSSSSSQSGLIFETSG